MTISPSFTTPLGILKPSLFEGDGLIVVRFSEGLLHNTPRDKLRDVNADLIPQNNNYIILNLIHWFELESAIEFVNGIPLTYLQVMCYNATMPRDFSFLKPT